MRTEGKNEMTLLFGIVFTLLGIVLALVYKDYVSENTKGDDAVALMAEAKLKINTKLKEYDEVINLYKKTIDDNRAMLQRNNDKYDAILKLSEELSRDCDEYDFGMKEVKILCSKLKKAIIKLQDRVSLIQPKVEVSFPVEVKTKGEGVKALIK